MKPLLTLEHLDVDFGSSSAVKNVSLSIGRGETLALVGESGSGKTVTALASIGLLPETASVRGTIQFDGETVVDAGGYHPDVLQRIRGKRIGMVFQEPMTALNPLHSIGRQIGEGLTQHLGLDGAPLKKRISELLAQVGLEELQHRLDAYPHQLSGGQRQRVMIAMAIACGPDLVIADEPTTALDAHLRGQICDLLKKLQSETGMALLFITHDLRMVRRLAHRVIVMRHGDIVEQGDVNTVFANPSNDYTRLLLDATPKGQPAPVPKDAAVILKASDVHVHYALARNLWGTPIRFQEAVEHVSLTLHVGETLGIVGESGSGKSSLGMALLRLQKADGSIVFQGQELIGKPLSAIRHLRKAFQVIFQDPFSSLNPRLSAGELVVEGL
ncbi:MAG: ABC transporter ATP-binding protein, partial [Alphaproteobacteria bacterium]|nr:ABC transporter ATP-binding protein [Alphaproteobacteria bacterium]